MDCRLLAARAALAAGAALFVAGCGGGDSADEAAANAADDNMLLEAPANDASALESVYNTAEPAAPDNTVADEAETDMDAGGDTGGNTLDSNVAGM